MFNPPWVKPPAFLPKVNCIFNYFCIHNSQPPRCCRSIPYVILKFAMFHLFSSDFCFLPQIGKVSFHQVISQFLVVVPMGLSEIGHVFHLLLSCVSCISCHHQISHAFTSGNFLMVFPCFPHISSRPFRPKNPSLPPATPSAGYGDVSVSRSNAWAMAWASLHILLSVSLWPVEGHREVLYTFFIIDLYRLCNTLLDI